MEAKLNLDNDTTSLETQELNKRTSKICLYHLGYVIGPVDLKQQAMITALDRTGIEPSLYHFKRHSAVFDLGCRSVSISLSPVYQDDSKDSMALCSSGLRRTCRMSVRVGTLS